MRISGKQLLKSMGWAISFIPRNPLFFHTEADFLLNNLVFIAIFCYTLLSDEEGDNFSFNDDNINILNRKNFI